jgi:hypothetical protein
MTAHPRNTQISLICARKNTKFTRTGSEFWMMNRMNTTSRKSPRPTLIAVPGSTLHGRLGASWGPSLSGLPSGSGRAPLSIPAMSADITL